VVGSLVSGMGVALILESNFLVHRSVNIALGLLSSLIPSNAEALARS
jgi:hypothetical protein